MVHRFCIIVLDEKTLAVRPQSNLLLTIGAGLSRAQKNGPSMIARKPVTAKRHMKYAWTGAATGLHDVQ